MSTPIGQKTVSDAMLPGEWIFRFVASWLTFAWLVAVGGPVMLGFVFLTVSFDAPAVAFVGVPGFIITPLLLLQVFLYSATATSFLTMLRPLAFSLSAPIGGNLGSRLGERAMVIFGSGAVVIAMVSFAIGAAQESIVLIAGGLAIAGMGLGVCQPSISAIVGNSVDEHSFGIASSAVQMASSVGAVAGISVLTAVTAGATSTEMFYQGYVYGAAIAAVGFAASFFIERRRREAS